VAEGGSITLKCLSDNKVEWHFKDSFLPRDVESSKNSIVVQQASEYHEGLYQCQGTYGGSNEMFFAKTYLRVIREFSKHLNFPDRSNSLIVGRLGDYVFGVY